MRLRLPDFKSAKTQKAIAMSVLAIVLVLFFAAVIYRSANTDIAKETGEVRENCTMISQEIVDKAKGDINSVDYPSVKNISTPSSFCQIPNSYKNLNDEQKLEYYTAGLNLSMLAFKDKDESSSKKYAEVSLSIFDLLPTDVQSKKVSSYEKQVLLDLFHGTYYE